MFLICTSQDLIDQAKNLADVELVDLKLQVDLIYKSEVIVFYHEGLFKFLKCQDKTKYQDILKIMKLEDDILPEIDFSKCQPNGSRLFNIESKDSLKCTVGFRGPTCFHVQNAVRVLGSTDQAAFELGIPLNAVHLALVYAKFYPYQSKTDD